MPLIPRLVSAQCTHSDAQKGTKRPLSFLASSWSEASFSVNWQIHTEGWAGCLLLALQSQSLPSLLAMWPRWGCVCVHWAELHLGLSSLWFDFWAGSVKEKCQLEARRRGTDELDCLGGHSPLLWPLRLPDCGSPQSTALSLVSFLQVCKLNSYETSHSSSWSGPLISYQNSDRYKVFYLSSILPGRPWGMPHLVNRVLFLLSLMSSFQACPLRVF